MTDDKNMTEAEYWKQQIKLLESIRSLLITIPIIYLTYRAVRL